MWPYIDDVHRFDFEVNPEDEYMVGEPISPLTGTVTPAESDIGSASSESLETC